MTFVCPRCFEETGLKKRIEEIRSEFPGNKCTYHPKYKGIPLKAVSKIIDGVFRAHYGFGGYYSFPHAEDDGVDHEQEGHDLIDILQELVLPTEFETTEALLAQLFEDDDYWPPDGEEAFYHEDQKYVRHELDDSRQGNLWQTFCKSIVHEQRFFNPRAKELMSEIFYGIHAQTDQAKNAVVYAIAPGTPGAAFFRARVADTETERKDISAKPSERLGPPPERNRRAGRMNPAGITAFYGAYDLDTCVAELRPVVGSTIVGAKFELVRPIYVLDTTRFEAPIKKMSLFNKDYMTRVTQWLFMQSFRRMIARPISPNDEHLDYIPTQAVAEYLSREHLFKRSGADVHIEGIIYRSAQFLGGRNIVLLGHAAHVLELKYKPSRGDGLTMPFDLSISELNFLDMGDKTKKAGVKLSDEPLHTLQVSGSQYHVKDISDHVWLDEDLPF